MVAYQDWIYYKHWGHTLDLASRKHPSLVSRVSIILKQWYIQLKLRSVTSRLVKTLPLCKRIHFYFIDYSIFKGNSGLNVDLLSEDYFTDQDRSMIIQGLKNSTCLESILLDVNLSDSNSKLLLNTLDTTVNLKSLKIIQNEIFLDRFPSNLSRLEIADCVVTADLLEKSIAYINNFPMTHVSLNSVTLKKEDALSCFLHLRNRIKVLDLSHRNDRDMFSLRFDNRKGNLIMNHLTRLSVEEILLHLDKSISIESLILAHHTPLDCVDYALKPHCSLKSIYLTSLNDTQWAMLQDNRTIDSLNSSRSCNMLYHDQLRTLSLTNPSLIVEHPNFKSHKFPERIKHFNNLCLQLFKLRSLQFFKELLGFDLAEYILESVVLKDYCSKFTRLLAEFVLSRDSIITPIPDSAFNDHQMVRRCLLWQQLSIQREVSI
ncbi:hypothetical protein HDV02_004396 [Globomyces sp. JEL0801]|nr:hypothetical protein HDV02_004396 [Globomyces sp. JEL0801]